MIPHLTDNEIFFFQQELEKIALAPPPGGLLRPAIDVGRRLMGRARPAPAAPTRMADLTPEQLQHAESVVSGFRGRPIGATSGVTSQGVPIEGYRLPTRPERKVPRRRPAAAQPVKADVEYEPTLIRPSPLAGSPTSAAPAVTAPPSVAPPVATPPNVAGSPRLSGPLQGGKAPGEAVPMTRPAGGDVIDATPTGAAGGAPPGGAGATASSASPAAGTTALVPTMPAPQPGFTQNDSFWGRNFGAGRTPESSFAPGDWYRNLTPDQMRNVAGAGAAAAGVGVAGLGAGYMLAPRRKTTVVYR